MRSSGLNEIFQMAKNDKRIVFVGSDLGFKVLDEFKNTLPEQFFMEGISEQYIIGMAAGMALNGKIVYVNTIASFLTRRCLDQISINLCLEKTNVRLFANGGGLIYGPMGPTHTIIEDIALMMALPNMAVIVPADKNQMLQLLKQSVDYQGPMYIRVARDNYPDLTSKHDIVFGEPCLLKNGETFAIISNGYMSHTAMKIAENLKADGLNVKVIDLHSLRPLNTQSLQKHLKGIDRVVTMEEHIKTGGLYSLVSDLILSCDLPIKIKNFSIPHQYSETYGEQDDLLKIMSLDPESMTNESRDFFLRAGKGLR
ncbi:transketolase [Bacteriovorax stolpii]|uniref:Transketolase n=1 Tax=Bacteriovorax stolpii TaxID=960 RepID=A0A2K9NWN3_BACTC|nr:transketolase C-terminal domain-containing protein [Bacteriovorax stolpii]AUN99922.1 transketolase [Bacteriovorax stolpii]QDK40085.1 transketolase [Bacteriovorax stolpii]TDP54184.1 transketolase subunit B [Bacteriovorax stolpii]